MDGGDIYDYLFSYCIYPMENVVLCASVYLASASFSLSLYSPFIAGDGGGLRAISRRLQALRLQE